jgi:hypothetical protein
MTDWIRQTSQGYIIRILQHFATKLRNILLILRCSFKLWWNFCPDLSRSKFHSKGERSIGPTKETWAYGDPAYPLPPSLPPSLWLLLWLLEILRKNVQCTSGTTAEQLHLHHNLLSKIVKYLKSKTSFWSKFLKFLIRLI